MINLNSVMINVIVNFSMRVEMKQWWFPSMYLPMMLLLLMKPLRRRRRGASKQNGCSTEGKLRVLILN